MNDIFFFYIIICLFAVILAEFLLIKYVFDQAASDRGKLLDEVSRATKAVIAKNANDYVMTTSIDKVPIEKEPAVTNEFGDPDELSDDEFDASLGIKRTPPKS